MIGGGNTFTIETFVPGVFQNTTANPIAPTCYGTLPSVKNSPAGSLPGASGPYITQFIPDPANPENSKLFYCGRSMTTGRFECYSLTGTAGATWTPVVFASPFTLNSIPGSFRWFIYNAQIFIATDSQAIVLNFATATGQNFTKLKHVFLSLCLSAPLSLCPSVSVSLCPSVPLFLCLCVPLSLCPSVPLSLCPSVPLSLCIKPHLQVAKKYLLLY